MILLYSSLFDSYIATCYIIICSTNNAKDGNLSGKSDRLGRIWVSVVA